MHSVILHMGQYWWKRHPSDCITQYADRGTKIGRNYADFRENEYKHCFSIHFKSASLHCFCRGPDFGQSEQISPVWNFLPNFRSALFLTYKFLSILINFLAKLLLNVFENFGLFFLPIIPWKNIQFHQPVDTRIIHLRHYEKQWLKVFWSHGCFQAHNTPNLFWYT